MLQDIINCRKVYKITEIYIFVVSIKNFIYRKTSQKTLAQFFNK